MILFDFLASVWDLRTFSPIFYNSYMILYYVLFLVDNLDLAVF